MTTATATFSYKSDTVAQVKVWIDGIKSLILAAGLVQSNDTGQLDSTTISTALTTGNAVYGFHVFKFPDALQTSMPIFVKITYQLDAGGGRPLPLFTVSSATDGAGVMSTPVFNNLTGYVGSYQDNVASYACYADGTFSLVLGYGATAGQNYGNAILSLVVDRSRSATGVATGAGYLAEGSYLPFGSQMQSRSLYGPTSPASNVNFIPALVPSVNAVSSAEGANVNVFRHYQMVPGVRPSVGVLTYFYAEFGALTPFSATVLGSAHTYLPMGQAMNYWSARPGADHCAAIRWE